MGNCNCLACHYPWTRLRRKHFGFRKAMAPSNSTTRSKFALQIANVVNLSAIGNATNAGPATGNVVTVPVTNNIVNVQVQDDLVSTVVSRIVAGAPKKDVVNLQIDSFRNVCMFTYKEICAATCLFRPDLILGEGGFGLVYKGVIDESVRPCFPSTEVAVKELNPDGYQGDIEWLTEVNYLGQFHHPNLVKLIGYCCEDEHRMLVYEYMANGNLETHLFRRHNTLAWSARMNIALDAAKGLAFLHDAERPIIYRDFKTSNILLDKDFRAKLSDFGLAKEGPMGDQTHVSTRVMGTYGYAAPEYIMTGHLTARSDVYGFGVVLLELIVGKRAVDKSRGEKEQNLVNWARPLLIRITKLLLIIDPKMQGQYSSKTADRVANLAHRCLSENPKMRPTMSEVVRELETCNQEEILIQKSKEAKALESANAAAAAAAAASKQEVESTEEESDCQHKHSSDSDGLQKQHTRSESNGNGNGFCHSLDSTNGSSEKQNLDVRQRHSISILNADMDR